VYLTVQKYVELVTSPITHQTCQWSLSVTKQIQQVSCK